MNIQVPSAIRLTLVRNKALLSQLEAKADARKASLQAFIGSMQVCGDC